MLRFISGDNLLWVLYPYGYLLAEIMYHMDTSSPTNYTPLAQNTTERSEESRLVCQPSIWQLRKVRIVSLAFSAVKQLMPPPAKTILPLSLTAEIKMRRDEYRRAVASPLAPQARRSPRVSLVCPILKPLLLLKCYAQKEISMSRHGSRTIFVTAMSEG